MTLRIWTLDGGAGAGARAESPHAHAMAMILGVERGAPRLVPSASGRPQAEPCRPAPGEALSNGGAPRGRPG
eukprot:scaffold100867_cov31-Tisochrysis_lutea.AAC.3